MNINPRIRRALWVVTALIAVPVWWAGRLYFRIHQQQTNGEVHTTLVLDYSGPLGDSKSLVRFRVYKVEKLSPGIDDSRSIFQNRIQLDEDARHVEFTWPADSEGPFAGSGGAVVDLVGDDTKEILVYDGGQDVRVVAYTEGQLRFRPTHDALESHGYDVGPTDLERVSVFVCGVPYPNVGSDPLIFVPRLFRWKHSTGFYDVRGDYPHYYRTRVFPDLRGRMTEEQDIGRRSLYAAAIRQLWGEITGRNGGGLD
jgi:hypothetical protein